MAIKIILLDIDGTLTNSKKEITAKTKETLLKAQEQGIRLALCSGRPEQGMYQWAEMLEMTTHNGIIVCYNGGKVVNCETKKVLYEQPIPIEDAKAVLEHVKKFDVSPMIDKGEYMYVTDVFAHDIRPNMANLPEVFNVMQYEARGNGFLLCEKRDLAEFVDFNLNKILTFGNPDYLKEHWKEMKEPFIGRLNCMFTSPFYYEYTAIGVDKARAIASAFEPMGYQREEMIAFGDAQNDETMLNYAGIGVAMGNADEGLKAIADEITASNEEDGIALTLSKYIEN